MNLRNYKRQRVGLVDSAFFWPNERGTPVEL
jgi:hypothetical protein